MYTSQLKAQTCYLYSQHMSYFNFNINQKSMLQSKLSQIQQQDQLYLTGLQQKIKILNMTNRPNYTFSGSGCRQIVQLIELPIFRLTLITGLISLQTNHVFSIMITASHNPASDNGIKIGYANGNVLSQQTTHEFQHLVNNDDSFINFISRKLSELKQEDWGRQHFCFLARDARQSSPKLSKIVCQTLHLIQIRPIDIGTCATPELFSLSQQILQHHTQNQILTLDMELQRKRYIQDTMISFKKCWQILNKKQKKPKILLDFSNGSGALSYARYKAHITEYFDITETNNIDFSHPNHKCGAEYYYKNWDLALNSQQFNKFDQCFFFDGDSDRIIGRIKGFSRPFDGNYFIVFFLKFLQQVFRRLSVNESIMADFCKQDVKLAAIGTFFTNLGVKVEVNKAGVEFYVTNIGTANLFRQAVKLQGISVFFEPNGHGGIYISQSIHQRLLKLLSKYPNNIELQMMVSLKQILKNNSKGYGLHNMLAYYICKQYLNIPLGQLQQLYVQAQQKTQTIRIKKQRCEEFKNSPNRNNQLSQPNSLLCELEKVYKNYSEYQIIIRKSATSKDMIRISVQGINLEICSQIIALTIDTMKQQGYIL